MAEPAKQSRRRTLAVRIAKWAVTVALCAYILYAVPLGDVPAITSKIDARYLAVGIIISFAHRVIFAWRWHVLLPAAGVIHSFVHTLGLHFIALFYQNFAPSTIGGDLTKGYLAAKGHDARGVDVAASVVADRSIGLISLVVMGLLSTLIIDMPELRLLLWGLAGVAIVGGGMVWLWTRSGAGQEDPPEQEAQDGGLVHAAAKKVRQTVVALVGYRDHKAALVSALAISCLGVIVAGAALRYWCLAFGFDLGLTWAIGVTVIATIVGMIPMSINGLGWTEGAKIVLLGLAGMSQPAALALSALQRVVATLFSLIGGVLQFFRKPS
jgi:glycosyltransferase 2 family protein